MENFDLKHFHPGGTAPRNLEERIATFNAMIRSLEREGLLTLRREVRTATDAEVEITDAATGRPRRVAMFGSNSYLGLTRHPAVLAAAQEALFEFGVGAGGPPLLNGTTVLHSRLERRLAALKGGDDCILFASGFQAQLGWIGALVERHDTVFFDEDCHASFYDGLRSSRAKPIAFRHNDVSSLHAKLRSHADPTRAQWLSVEGVYSMNGDLAPLPEIADLAEEYNCRLIIDDAHGTGIFGEHGAGTASELGVDPRRIFLHLGTLSKTFSMAGGFLVGDRETISYLRYVARPHMFSAALPPTTIAAVVACLDVIRAEPERIARLHANVRTVCTGLGERGFEISSRSGIVPIRLPPGQSAFEACRRFEERGVFVNGVQYPAVPRNEDRLRISVMATHQPPHLERLLSAVEEVLSPSLTL